MQDAPPQNLEGALARTEEDAIAALKAAEAVTKALRRFRAAARDGNLRDLQTTLDAAEQALAGLRQQFSNAKDGWDFDADRYFADGLLPKEVIAAAQQLKVNIFERDDRLYCYPALIRVAAGDRAVMIDKQLVRAVRPTVLAERLRKLQRKPPRFRPGQFLTALYNAYKKAAATRGKDSLATAPVIPLSELYELFTLLPGQTREYTRQEFGRDLYLLHQSGENIIPGQARMELIPPRDNFSRNQIRVVTADGSERGYYAVAFSQLAGGAAESGS